MQRHVPKGKPRGRRVGAEIRTRRNRFLAFFFTRFSKRIFSPPFSMHLKQVFSIAPQTITTLRLVIMGDLCYSRIPSDLQKNLQLTRAEWLHSEDLTTGYISLRKRSRNKSSLSTKRVPVSLEGRLEACVQLSLLLPYITWLPNAVYSCQSCSIESFFSGMSIVSQPLSAELEAITKISRNYMPFFNAFGLLS